MMENKTTIILVILCVSAAVFLLIGIRLLLAPERKRESFRKARAVIVSRGSGKDGGFRPLLEFRDGEKIVRAHPSFSMTDGPECREGCETDILFCPKRLTRTVIPDDGGRSLQRIGRFYRITGAGMILVGLLFLIPIFIMIQKR